jgi:hypothetical protein
VNYEYSIGKIRSIVIYMNDQHIDLHIEMDISVKLQSMPLEELKLREIDVYCNGEKGTDLISTIDDPNQWMQFINILKYLRDNFALLNYDDIIDELKYIFPNIE